MAGKIKDITGKVFGHLTAIRPDGFYESPTGYRKVKWLCECSCGNHVSLIVNNLIKKGTIQSCGWCKATKTPRKFKDLKGLVFNRLTVIEQDKVATMPNGKTERRWICKCSCGNTISVSTYRLTSGRLKSCGCYHKDLVTERSRLTPGESSFNCFYSSYKYGAKKRGLFFSLSKDTFKKITGTNCYYCDAPPRVVNPGKRNYGDYFGNGIDRIDSTKGYEEGNVVSCCTACNTAKMSQTQEEFFDMVRKIYEKHLRSK